jgi:hypothetical protein
LAFAAAMSSDNTPRTDAPRLDGRDLVTDRRPSAQDTVGDEGGTSLVGSPRHSNTDEIPENRPDNKEPAEGSRDTVNESSRSGIAEEGSPTRDSSPTRRSDADDRQSKE